MGWAVQGPWWLLYMTGMFFKEANLWILKLLSWWPLERNWLGWESFFHGQSSGIDPLVAYLQKPLLLKRKTISVLEGYFPGAYIYLLDTGIKADTGNQMGYFLDKNTSPDFARKIKEVYIPLVNQAIQLLISGEDVFFEALDEISRFQYENLLGLFPVSIHKFIKKGIETKKFSVKLCGSGGGGFVLLFSRGKLSQDDFGGLPAVGL